MDGGRRDATSAQHVKVPGRNVGRLHTEGQEAGGTASPVLCGNKAALHLQSPERRLQVAGKSIMHA